MKLTKLLIAIALMSVFCFTAFAQTQAEPRVIEVTGSAETLITPNEFTFKITLIERVENKQKLTIEMQQAKLETELANFGVNVQKDLTIYDLTSVYVYRKKLKDTLGSKDFRLKLHDLNKIEKALKEKENL